MGVSSIIATNIFNAIQNKFENIELLKYGHQEIDQIPQHVDVLIYCLGTHGGVARSNIHDAFASHCACLHNILYGRNIIKIIYLSSIHVYMRSPELDNISTFSSSFSIDIHNEEHFYDQCKLLSESSLLMLSKEIDINILRLGHVINANPQPHSLIGYMSEGVKNKTFTFFPPRDAFTYFVTQEAINSIICSLIDSKSDATIHNVICDRKFTYNYLSEMLIAKDVDVKFESNSRFKDHNLPELQSSDLLSTCFSNSASYTTEKLANCLCLG